jgi:hypothetical protein
MRAKPMDEQQWLSCTDPEKMLEFLRDSGKASERKLRLFACACVRPLWHLLDDERGRQPVEVAEGFADGAASGQELEAAAGAGWELYYELMASAWAAHDAARAAGSPHAAWDDRSAAREAAAGEAARTAHQDAAVGARAAAWEAVHERGAWTLERRALGTTAWHHYTHLLRDLFGNPFRPVEVNPAWRGGAAVRLAQAIYEERSLPSGHLDAGRLAVLADMLEEAGCPDPQLLGHLRGPGPHVRGYFAVDLLLGKS